MLSAGLEMVLMLSAELELVLILSSGLELVLMLSPGLELVLMLSPGLQLGGWELAGAHAHRRCSLFFVDNGPLGKMPVHFFLLAVSRDVGSGRYVPFTLPGSLLPG